MSYYVNLVDRLSDLCAHSIDVSKFASEMAATGATKEQILGWIDNTKILAKDQALEEFCRDNMNVAPGVAAHWPRRCAAYLRFLKGVQ